jgi:hypothetical protein
LKFIDADDEEDEGDDEMISINTRSNVLGIARKLLLSHSVSFLN